jgi:uncharacterized membrane protein
MENIQAQVIDERNIRSYIWGHFKEWTQDSLLLLPIVFMTFGVVLALAFRYIDRYLTFYTGTPDWIFGNSETIVSVTTVIASSMLAFLAIVFSIALVAFQLANQQFSPRVLRIFERSVAIKVTLSIFIATFVYSLILLSEILWTKRTDITLVSMVLAILLVFTSVVFFVVFIKSILVMIRVSTIITTVANETQRAIEQNLPPESKYDLCQFSLATEPERVIHFKRKTGESFSSRHHHGVLKEIERTMLIRIAHEHQCVLRVLPRHGAYINPGDPIVELYGKDIPSDDQILKAIHIGRERTINQDPAYGLRILVDIALQALSPGILAPTTASQVVYRLTNLLALIAQRPEQTGAFADHEHAVRLLHPILTWEEYVDLAFTEIWHYGSNDPQIQRHLPAAIDYLQVNVSAAHQRPLEKWRDIVQASIQRIGKRRETNSFQVVRGQIHE